MGILDPTEQQLQRYWDRIQRALQVLQKAQRYDVDPMGDYYQGEAMVHSEHGDYVDADDVSKAIDILQEGQQ